MRCARGDAERPDLAPGVRVPPPPPPPAPAPAPPERGVGLREADFLYL